jgi:copper chaperone CopZ
VTRIAIDSGIGSNSPRNARGVIDLEMKLRVSNVKCGGCVQAIQTGLAALSGVAGVEVDIPTGLVTVTGDNLPTDQIAATLTGLGYPPVDTQ